MGCVEYAKARRPDLGAAGGSAANYIENYRDSVFQVTDDDADLTSKVAQGYAVVWPKHVLSPDSSGYENGHVAIVEEVGPDYVIVSQAGWGEKTRMRVTKEDLQSLYLIP